MQPSSKTVKRLCTLSGNRCAFYGCTVPLVADDSDAVAGEICHIKASGFGGPRYDPSQTEDERHAFANLILLCSTHHTLIDSDLGKYTVEYLQQMKAAHNPTANIEVLPADASRAERLLKKYGIQVNGPVTVGHIQAQTVVFRGQKSSRPKVPLPINVVGGSSVHRRYIAHLIDRYKKFAAEQRGRTFRHPVIYETIKREFGATWEWVGLNRFEELATFLQKKIDNTIIGKLNARKRIPRYSLFEEYCMKHQPAKKSAKTPS